MATTASTWVALTLTLACAKTKPTPPPNKPQPEPEAQPAPEPQPTAKPEVNPQPGAPSSCGPLDCRLFPTPKAAFESILATKPAILAIGETHALAGTEAIESTTARFTKQLLPSLQGRASDLIVELVLPDPKCKKKTEAVRERQTTEVTKTQSKENQNEFVLLGYAAKDHGVVPHILKPTCEDFDKIVNAGPNGMLVMLSTITRLTEAMAKSYYDRNQVKRPDHLIAAYGGAMHNDLYPRKGREQWSFGPALSEHTGRRYVEIDLIVREFIQDTPAWKSQPWYDAFDREKNPDQAVLLTPKPNSYVLVFPRSEAVKPAAPTP